MKKVSFFIVLLTALGLARVASAGGYALQMTGPAPVSINDEITYTIKVTSYESSWTWVGLSDILPAGVEFKRATKNGQPFDRNSDPNLSQQLCEKKANTNEIDCNWVIASDPNGRTDTVEIVVTAKQEGQLVNTATLSNNNQSATVTTSVIDPTPRANLELTELRALGNSNRAPLNGNAYYTIKITNHGPTNATNMTVVYVYDGSFRYVDNSSIIFLANGSCHKDPNPNVSQLICTLDELDAGSWAAVQFTLVPTQLGTFQSQAAVSSTDTRDDNAQNNKSPYLSTTVENPSADLTVSATATPNAVSVNDQIQYTVTVKNKGPDEAQNVKFQDFLPAGVTFVSATSNPNVNCTGSGVVTCNFAKLLQNDTAQVDILVKAPSAGTLQNTARAYAMTDDPNTNDNEVVTTTVVTGPPPPPPPTAVCGDGHTDAPETCDDGNTVNGDGCDSHCQIEPPAPPPPPPSPPQPPVGGGNIGGGNGTDQGGDGTASAGNEGGTGGAQNGDVNDTVPQGVRITAAQGGGCACAINLPDARGFNPVILGLTVLMLAPLAMLRFGRHRSLKALAVVVPSLVVVGVSHSAFASTTSDLQIVSLTVSPNPVAVGNDLTYTIVVKNNGPDDATDVTILANPITGGVTYKSAGTVKNGVSETSTCRFHSYQNPAHDEVGCQISRLNVGESATTTMVLSPTTVGTLHSRVIAIPNWQTVDPDFSSSNSNNFAQGDVTVVPEEADLEVTVKDNADPVTVFEDFAYDITLKNIGVSTAKNVKLTDTLPGYVSYKSSQVLLVNGNCQIQFPVFNCDLDDIAPGDKALIQIVVTPYKENVTLTDTDYASTSTFESVTNNNRAQEDTHVVEPPPPPPPTAVCGDGHIDLGLGETCDDGNTLSGDGCDSHCQLEPPVPPQPSPPPPPPPPTPPQPPVGGGNIGGGNGTDQGGDGTASAGNDGRAGETQNADEGTGVPTGASFTSAQGGGCACAINKPDTRGFDPAILIIMGLALSPLIWLRLRKETNA